MVLVCGFYLGRYTERYYVQYARSFTAKNQINLGVFLGCSEFQPER